MLKGKSNKSITTQKDEKTKMNIEKLREKQIMNLEFLKNLENNIKRHSNQIKESSVPKLKKLKQHTLIEKYILSKNIEDSNVNNSTKISSLTNNLSENKLKNISNENRTQTKSHCTSLKEYLNYKLNKIESEGTYVEDEVEQLKKCLVSYVNSNSYNRNRSSNTNCSFTESKHNNSKNKSFSHFKLSKKENMLNINDLANLNNSRNASNTILSKTNSKSFLRKNGSCQIKLNDKNQLKNTLNLSVNRTFNKENISENQLFSENFVDSRVISTTNNKSQISEEYSQQYDKITKQKLVILKRILNELVEKFQTYPFLYIEIENIFQEFLEFSSNQSFSHFNRNTFNNSKSFIDNCSEDNLLKNNNKFNTCDEYNIKRENTELKQKVLYLENKIKNLNKSNSDIKKYFANLLEKQKKDNVIERRFYDKYKLKKNMMNNIEELETISNNSEEVKENNGNELFKQEEELNDSIKLDKNYHSETHFHKQTSIKELEDHLESIEVPLIKSALDSNSQLLKDGNFLENNISLDNLETELKKVELEMKFSKEISSNDYNSSTIKFKNK